ncbi:MAG TPA: helix-turn-helix domain-containing protein, partial [Gemmata sp.]|nr:helix-turn-helix domain-containing protein [Gemmata sp.]
RMPNTTKVSGKTTDMARQAATLGSVYGKGRDRYLDLIQRFPLRPIRSDSDLDAAVEVIDSLIDQDRRSAAEEDYLDVLSDLVEAYEDKTIPISQPDDSGMLRLLIDAKGVTQVAVAKKTGIAESTISAVLSGKRKLTRGQIGKLSRYFHVSPAAFDLGD